MSRPTHRIAAAINAAWPTDIHSAPTAKRVRPIASVASVMPAASPHTATAARRPSSRRSLSVMQLDCAASVVIRGNADLDVPIFEFCELPLGPFDQLYTGSGQELGNADLHPLAWSLRQPITVDMDDRLAAQPRIFMNDGERRRRHLAWVGSQLCSDGPRQKRLARAKVADKVHD